ncbi:hypothetical protein FB567DRAFT_612918 [Paraphoma chrysanthemicola]|uniref:Uncharacterized protein n=1 Tax=Paraphoma chrysanthemicola TaxID=798071 RepID=A0A8K0QTW9_9PLEO|nr:hypothetical protein FB567DRAFT_612918 [Paraphoma chrysanthemicola]
MGQDGQSLHQPWTYKETSSSLDLSFTHKLNAGASKMLSYEPGPVTISDVLFLLYATQFILLAIYVRRSYHLIRRHIKRTQRLQDYQTTVRTAPASHPQPIATPLPIRQRFAARPLNAHHPQQPQRHQPPTPLHPPRPTQFPTRAILARIEQRLDLVDRRVGLLQAQMAATNNNALNQTNLGLPDDSTSSTEGSSTTLPSQNERP